MINIYVLEKNGVPFYVGKSKNSKTRFSHHKREKNAEQYFIIDEVENDEWEFWENHYILLFKSWGFILENQNDGGGGRKNISEEEKQYRSKLYTGRISPMKGKQQSEYNKQKTREAHLGINYHTKEGLDKISKVQKERDRTEEAKKKWKKVGQYSLDGTLIKIWDSLKEPTDHYNIPNGNISLCCRQKCKTIKGFIWRFI